MIYRLRHAWPAGIPATLVGNQPMTNVRIGSMKRYSGRQGSNRLL